MVPAGVHSILQFDSQPGSEIRDELERRGVRVLAVLPDTGLMVVSPRDIDLSDLGARSAGPMQARDKLSKQLDAAPAPAYLVMFHADVPGGRARAALDRWGFAVIENRYLRPGHFVVIGNAARLEDLASEDDVSYILPASPDLAAGAPVIGCDDGIAEAGAVADYAIAASGWSKDPSGVAALNYVFESLPAGLNSSDAQSQIVRAFNEWERYAAVSFTSGGSASASRTVAILTASGAHGDAYPFTSSNVLAHTFYPAPLNTEPIAGDMHFNAEESWAIGSSTDLFSVALHEIGHALGLGHTDIPGAVMYPYYQFLSGLGADDISGVQALYGPATTTSTTPAATTPATPSTPATPAPSTPTTPSTTTPSTPSAPTPATPATPATPDTTPPSLTILSPGVTILATSAASITVSGMASDNVGVASVQWSTSLGYSGAAHGTAAWSAQVPLLVGTNAVTVRAFDAAGNSAWRAITVVRR